MCNLPPDMSAPLARLNFLFLSSLFSLTHLTHKPTHRNTNTCGRSAAPWIKIEQPYSHFPQESDIPISIGGDASQICRWTGRLTFRRPHHRNPQTLVSPVLRSTLFQTPISTPVPSPPPLLPLLRRTSSGMFRQPSNATVLLVRSLSLSNIHFLFMGIIVLCSVEHFESNRKLGFFFCFTLYYEDLSF